jgi:hypothetical protein
MRRLNAINRKQALKVVKELDAFPKVLDVKTTTFIVYLHLKILNIDHVINNITRSCSWRGELDTTFCDKVCD